MLMDMWGVIRIPMTISEKIIAVHCERDEVSPGEFVEVKVDLVMGHDVSVPRAIEEFYAMGCDRVFSPDRVVLVLDHFVPARDVQVAEQCKRLRSFARRQGLRHFFDVGRGGICHAVLPERGLVLPGDLVVGGDSHTCMYGALGAFATGVGGTDLAAAMALGETWLKVPESIKILYEGEKRGWVGGKDLILATLGLLGVDGARGMVIEFAGSALPYLSIEDRLSVSNMAVEAGAECGIMSPDTVVLDYISTKAERPYRIYQSDEDARYSKVVSVDLSRLEPQVALPPSPDNVKPVSEVRGIPIDQAIIGSCGSGGIGDLRVAVKAMNGRPVHENVRLIIIPGTQETYLRAMREGLLELFIKAGGIISPPTCGPCCGGHMGVLAGGERAISTTNRNFTGRMGHPQSEVYLASAAVVAASAVVGKIAAPEEVSFCY